MRTGKSEAKGEFVGFGGGRVFGDVRLVASEIFYDFWGLWVVEGDLAEDGKTGAYAAFVGDVLEFGVGVVDVVAHFVGEGENV